MGKVIIEGIGACFIILLVCVIGIANGAVGLVHMYEKDVRDRAIETGCCQNRIQDNGRSPVAYEGPRQPSARNR